MNKEYRKFGLRELRVSDGKQPKIRGKIRYNELSEDLGGFQEKIQAGAFAESIRTGNVFALWSHDDSKPIANMRAGSLRLNDGADALDVEIRPDMEISWAADAYRAIKRGDSPGLSFGFRVVKDTWQGEIRTVQEAELLEVSPCVFPAYSTNEITARNQKGYKNMTIEQIQAELLRKRERMDALEDKRTLSNEEKTELRSIPDEIEDLEKDLKAARRREELRGRMDEPEDGYTPVAHRIQEEDQNQERGRKQDTEQRSFRGGTDYRSLFDKPVSDDLDRGGFKDLREFLSTIVSGRADDRLQVRTMSTNLPSTGGFLVPDDFRADIIDRAMEKSILFKQVDKVPMPHGNLTVPGIDDNDHSTDRKGITAGWIGEGEEMAFDDIATRQIKLDSSKLYILIKVNNEWLHDAPGADRMIRNILAAEIGWQMDHVLLNTGTGAGQPLSFLNADSTLEAAAEGAQAAQSLLWENCCTMYESLNPAAEPRAQWFISPSLKKEALTMSLTIGTGGSAVLPAINAGAENLKLLGKPVHFSEHCKYKGTKGDVHLLDPKSMLLGLTEDLRIDVSGHYAFRNDQTIFRAVLRCDAMPKQSSTLVLSDGSHTVSDAVVLAART